MTFDVDDFLRTFMIANRDIFWNLADALHTLAIAILFYKMLKTKSCAGISGKTQMLYAIIFITRYLDLSYIFVTGYNRPFIYTAKILYIFCSLLTNYLIFFRYRRTYDRQNDNFYNAILILSCLILALQFNYDNSLTEIFWAFSIYLEAVAIVPQLFLVRKVGRAEYMTTYLVALGLYRAFYFVHWLIRYELTSRIDYISFISGFIQSTLFILFFCIGPKETSANKEFAYKPGSLVCDMNDDKIFSLSQYVQEKKATEAEKQWQLDGYNYCKLQIYQEPNEVEKEGVEKEGVEKKDVQKEGIEKTAK